MPIVYVSFSSANFGLAGLTLEYSPLRRRPKADRLGSGDTLRPLVLQRESARDSEQAEPDD
jgi:hypothetical protein